MLSKFKICYHLQQKGGFTQYTSITLINLFIYLFCFFLLVCFCHYFICTHCWSHDWLLVHFQLSNGCENLHLIVIVFKNSYNDNNNGGFL